MPAFPHGIEVFEGPSPAGLGTAGRGDGSSEEEG